MRTLHLLLKLQRLFSVNTEDETSFIHAWSTGQLKLRNAVLGVLMNKPLQLGTQPYSGRVRSTAARMWANTFLAIG